MTRILRACLESLLKAKIVGRIRSKYTCTYRSFSLVFRFSPRDLRQALRSLFGFFAMLAFVSLYVSPSLALDPGKDGYYTTGQGIRVKNILFVDVNVYKINHAMKALPPTKSKQAVIDMDVDKRFVARMMRDVEGAKMGEAMREGFAKNGYNDTAKINKLLSGITGNFDENDIVSIWYNSATKVTTFKVEKKGSTSIDGVDFMKATWSIWLGKIDQPSLSDALISKIP